MILAQRIFLATISVAGILAFPAIQTAPKPVSGFCPEKIPLMSLALRHDFNWLDEQISQR